MSIIGHTLKNKYKIKSILGSGGMGTVYLAERKDIGDEVAIKVLKNNLNQEQMLNEAKANALLSQPNICKVFDYFEEDNSQYLVFERLEGYDLAEIFQYLKAHREKIPVAQAIAIIKKCLEALTYAHHLNKGDTQAIYHRDIKPANIFFTNQGEIKILDFGIATFAGDEKSKERYHDFHSECYGCPDLWTSSGYRGDKFQSHNDLYSLGLVFYELITGQKAFSTLEELKNGHFKEVNQFIKCTERFQLFLNKWLSKNPSERFKDGKDILASLEEFEDSEISAESAVKWVLNKVNQIKSTNETLKATPPKEQTKKPNFFFPKLDLLNGLGAIFALIVIVANVISYRNFSQYSENKNNYRAISSVTKFHIESDSACYVIGQKETQIYYTSNEEKFYELQKKRKQNSEEFSCFTNFDEAIKEGFRKAEIEIKADAEQPKL